MKPEPLCALAPRDGPAIGGEGGARDRRQPRDRAPAAVSEGLARGRGCGRGGDPEGGFILYVVGGGEGNQGPH